MTKDFTSHEQTNNVKTFKGPKASRQRLRSINM